MHEETSMNVARKSETSSKRHNLLGLLLALVLAGGSFISGMQVDSLIGGNTQTANLFSFFTTNKTTPDTEANLDQFWRVWNLMESKHISASSTEVISDEEKINGAIKGLVASYGDPYSVYFPPVESAAFAEDISGNFSGVGMEIGLRDNVITIIAPLPGTPAEKAGLLSGDKIIKIDGETTEGMMIDEAVRRIRGEKDTVVNLTVYREGETEFRDISVTRDTINVPTVATELIGDVFVVKLYSFNAIAETKMQDAMREYTESGAKLMVLDLRGNPGGYLQSAVAIASYFLPAGKVVVREHFGEGNEERQYRSQGKMLKRMPEKLVVLVDGGSASASEILAGALKEHGVATVIGETTFGKGSVQELVDLPNGSSIKITVARWLTPDGLSISDGGLMPNITIKRTAEQRLQGEDTQQNAALRFIKGEEVVSE
jgi:carboxyl-terminal processing protease